MGGVSQNLAGTITSGRQTTVTWDITEDVIAEPLFIMRREGSQISPSTRSGVERLASGVWVLSPTAGRSEIHETTDAQQYTVRLTDVTAASVIGEVATNRQLSELTGIGAAGTVLSTGDYFFNKRVAAGVTWASTVSGGPPQPALPTAQYPMDRVILGNALHASHTSYFLSYLLPGAALAAPDWISTFTFGGPVVGAATAAHKGYGQFALSLAGDGRARLHEYIDGAWSVVNEWRFATVGQTPVTAIGIRIFVHFPRFIEFRMAATPFEDGLIGDMAAIAKIALKGALRDTSGLSTFVHEVTNRGDLATSSGALLPVTGPGQIALDMRRDLRCRVQIQRLSFPASGTLTDRAFTVPYNPSTLRILRLTLLGYDFYQDDATALTALSGVLQKSDGTALTASNESYTLGGKQYNISGWLPPADGFNACRALITFTNNESAGARWHSPSLTGYEVAKNGVIQTHAPGAFTGGTVRDVSISGAGFQPDHETASLVIEDATNALPTLRARGRIGVRVETSVPGTSQRSVLFEGYSGRITARLKGRAGAARVYPSSQWRQLTAELVGKWDRLSDRFFTQRWVFANDSNSPSGRTGKIGLPWKVTDVIRVLLNSQGFADSQLDIFDDPIRLFARTRQEAEGLLVTTPGQSIPEYLTRLSRDFLNAAIVWDANAGAAGMWRLLRPPTGAEPILWNFVTTLPGPGKLPHLSASYGASTSPILDPPGEFRTWVVPPEGNVLVVSGGVPPGSTSRISRTLYNPSSWNTAQHANSADATSLDYLGRPLEVYYTDVTITDPQSLAFVARRLYNLALRGRKFAMFRAEAVLVSPNDPVYTVRKWRPLRTFDSIAIDGVRYILHSVSIAYKKSYAMFADYEAELFRSDTGFW